MDGPDCEHYAPLRGLELVKGVLSHTAVDEDHIVQSLTSGVHTSLQSLSQARSSSCLTTLIWSLGRCCGRLRRWLYGTTQAARLWQREREKGIKAAGMVMEEVSRCSFELVGVMHGDDTSLAGPR